MSETVKLTAEARELTGSIAARRARSEGKIPAIVYGRKEAPQAIYVAATAMEDIVRHGTHGLLELTIGGKAESAVLKDLQWDVFGREILHVDFARVSKGQRITQVVPVNLKGTAPGLSEGGVLDFQMHSIELECPVDALLDSLVINVNHLHLNQSILVKDLPLPAGVVAKAAGEQVVLQIVPPAQEKEPEEGEAAGGVEPELIRREKPAEDAD